MGESDRRNDERDRGQSKDKLISQENSLKIS